jgi:hypothetical protein
MLDAAAAAIAAARAELKGEPGCCRCASAAVALLLLLGQGGGRLGVGGRLPHAAAAATAGLLLQLGGRGDVRQPWSGR